MPVLPDFISPANDAERIKSPDEILIENEFQALLDDYLCSRHRKKVEIITKAFQFANNAHKGARRRSGEPYILHPLAVARICTKEIGLGSTSICAALLHDVVEDTEYTVEDIANLFNPKVAQLVDGLTKISGGIFGEQASQQAESFRRLLLTMPDDIRVIIIKMADRLHNMRTLQSMPQAKQFKIAGETLYIYAPLAHRLGLNRIKQELEDLSFKYEHPETYQQIEQKIIATNALRKEIYDNFSAPIKKALDKKGVKYEMKARTKSVYSIWNKMRTKNVAFEEVFDLMAVRIIFESDGVTEEGMQCFSIYSTVTQIYIPHPERLRDWVNHPKANGYRAVHVTVMGKNGQWIEVQIRSREMDEVAEKGFAAHWNYKTGVMDEDNELNRWILTVKDILENPEPNAIDFLDTVKMNLFSNEIFVCTPRGEFKTLPQGATALDFAFSLHSDVGYNCIGAKVNHKLVPLSHKLNSGDQVEVLTSKSQNPKPDWLHYVTTAKARNKLNLFYRKERRIQINNGELSFENFLATNGLTNKNTIIDKLMAHLSLAKREELFLKIGTGELKLNEALIKVLKSSEESRWMKLLKSPFTNPLKKSQEEEEEVAPPVVIDKKMPFLITENDLNKKYSFCQICNPIPGDDTLGYVNEEKKLTVHARSCPVAMTLKSGFGNQIVLVKWGDFSHIGFDVSIEIAGIDKPGVLMQITHLLFETLKVNIHRIHFDTTDGIFKGTIGVKVKTSEETKKLCADLLKIESVQTAARANSIVQ